MRFPFSTGPIQIILALFIVFAFSHTLSGQSGGVRVTGKLTQCDQDTLYFFQLDGKQIYPLASFPLTKVDTFYNFDISLSQNLPKGYYLLGTGQVASTKGLILGEEPSISIQGACPSLNSARVLNSPENDAYQRIMYLASDYQRQFSTLIRKYQQAFRRKQPTETIVTDIVALDDKKKALMKMTQEEFPFLAKIIALNMYLSYQGNGKEGESEADYFANHYFEFVDFSDPAYNYIPQLKDAMKNYAQNLAQVGLSHDQQMKYIEQYLGQMKEGTFVHKMTLIGLIEGFQGKNEDAFVKMIDRYLAGYSASNPSIAKQYEDQARAIRSRSIGAIAPEIRLPNPEGDTLSLSALRGNIVLVDFWASWCGPCRRENPRVKAMYEKYHEQGFEIFGVSLDKDKARWVKAIEDDGLTWYHVSDLKYWRSIAGRTYGVGSIPATVLLDREGRIVAKNLRGPSLEAKVGELLEEN